MQRNGGFIEQQPMTVRRIPIPDVQKDYKEYLSHKVEELLNLTARRQELSIQSLEVLIAEYRVKHITSRLEEFLKLGWNEFLEELEKQRVRMSLTQKDNLNVWFRSKQYEANKLSESMEKLNQEIDACVYKLYNLDDAEIRLIEKSNNN